MIAVIASVVILLYILAPGGLFRVITAFTFPVKSQKTKTQEFTFAALFGLAPFLLALLLVWANWPFPTPETDAQRRYAYRTVYESVTSDKQMDNAIQEKVFWSRMDSVLRRQKRFLSWYWFFVMVEAFYVSWLGRQYRTHGKRWRDKIAGVVLPPIVSEWAVLLTNFGSPKTKTRIELDVLSTDGVLYQGALRDKFFGAEGDLAGLLLSHAARYDRTQYAAHKQVDLDAAVANWPKKPAHSFTQERATYWRLIPGADLFYIPRERIANINVRHVISDSDIPKATQERLADRKILGYAITEQPTQSATSTTTSK